MTTETKHEVAISTKPRASEVAEARPSAMFGPLEEVERLFDRLMPHAWMRPMAWNWPAWGGFDESLEAVRMPQMDIIDHDREYLIRIEVPGVEKKDIDVSVSEDTLSIKGSMSRESKEQKKDYFRCEIAQGNFARSMTLPKGVDTNNLSASLKDGILEIVLPKVESVQRRTIEVK